MGKNKKSSWSSAALLALLVAVLFCIPSKYLLDSYSQYEAAEIVNGLAIQFAFTFLGILISAYAILQTIASNVEAPSAKLKETDLKLWQKINGRYRLMRSSVFDAFKKNMMRLMVITLIFLLTCIITIPLLGIRIGLALCISTLQVFGISFIAVACLQHLRALFSAV